ncbi:helix-turn-helix domain-containing protein [Enterobacter wuhouensis]|jgi:CRP-like cAMP-binding protein|uniref:helix-turn-helix domain-containing protein n=1 Tax=Enterobacter wuhouensis TaxID=2529381 RepID=UPI0021E53C60|nr:helix-turn-helix domain-containing protein [Enterobacter wuhouensis]MCV2534496.1 helix-turn-helix domain-containing protein [Enterobacter wuhouensis]
MTNQEKQIKRKVDLYTFYDETLEHPDDKIKHLIEKLSPLGVPVNLKARERLSMIHKGQKVCYIITSGYFSCLRKGDGTTITNVYPPMFIGLGEVFSNFSSVHFYAEVPVEAIRITGDDLEAYMAANPDQWRNLVIIFSYVMHRLMIRDSQIIAGNAYQIVRNLLLDLMNQPDKVRESISASRFILERTKLSRSTVMHILSELSRGEYIALKRYGFLAEIKRLPEKF